MSEIGTTITVMTQLFDLQVAVDETKQDLVYWLLTATDKLCDGDLEADDFENLLGIIKKLPSKKVVMPETIWIY